MITITVTGGEAVQKLIEKTKIEARAAAAAALVDCAMLAQTEAKKNAPRSPTQEQITPTLKRKKKSTRKVTPGGLQRSISSSVDKEKLEASVHVAANSEAGQYAQKIHDEKGKKWFKRGIGTEKKGARADEKFIERAVNDNRAKFQRYFDREAAKAAKKLNSQP